MTSSMRLPEGSTRRICTARSTSISLDGTGQRNAEEPCRSAHRELGTRVEGVVLLNVLS
jgi:hypothetical protein